MFPQNQKLNKTIWFQIMIERQYMCGRNVLKYLCTFWLIYVHFRAQLANFESCILGDWDRSVIHHDTSLIWSRAWIWCFSKIFLDFKDFLLGLTQMWRDLFHPFWVRRWSFLLSPNIPQIHCIPEQGSDQWFNSAQLFSQRSRIGCREIFEKKPNCVFKDQNFRPHDKRRVRQQANAISWRLIANNLKHLNTSKLQKLQKLMQ